MAAPISIENYHRMIDAGVFDEWKVELIKGVLFEKMSKSELHVFLVNWIFRQLDRLCPEDEFYVRKEDPIVTGNSEPEPDISVVKGTLDDFRSNKPATAEFVVEVANSSLALDREKASDYASAGVAEYWIVCPELSFIEVHSEPVDGVYLQSEVIAGDNLVASKIFPDFSLRLSDLLGSE